MLEVFEEILIRSRLLRTTEQICREILERLEISHFSFRMKKVFGMTRKKLDYYYNQQQKAKVIYHYYHHQKKTIEESQT